MATTEKNVLMRGKDSEGNPILYYPITTAENVDGLDESLDTKSAVQLDGKLLPEFKIHKMTQEEYDQAVNEGTLDENALYLTPDEEIDLSGYVTTEQLNAKADVSHTHGISDVADLQTALDDLDAKAIQPDWSINDEDDPAYIKNRTHWDKGEGEVIVLPECNFYGEEYEDGSFPQYIAWYETEDMKVALVEGKTYSVVLNGTVYECDSWYYPPLDCVCLGNIEYLNESYHGNDDPFAICYKDGKPYFVAINGAYAVSISTRECIFQQLDPRYVKGMYYTDTNTICTSLVGSLSMDFASCDSVDWDWDTGLSGYIYKTLQLESTITVGQEYIVEFDSVNYPCTARSDIGYYDIIIGNRAFVDAYYEDNGLPFAICISSDMDTLAHVIVGDQNKHDLYILSKGPLIHQIPECYIPKSILSGKANISDLTTLETSISNTNDAVADKADLNHNHDSSYDTKGAADTALASAKSYADAKVAALVDSAPETMDTLNELAAAISEHQEVTDALDAAITSKANASDLTALQTQVSNKTTVQIITWEDDD